MPRRQTLIPRLAHPLYSISKDYAKLCNSLIVFARRNTARQLVTVSLALPQVPAMIELLNLTNSVTL
jgi:hypothetical protein